MISVRTTQQGVKRSVNRVWGYVVAVSCGMIYDVQRAKRLQPVEDDGQRVKTVG